jgi:hypothetical protein
MSILNQIKKINEIYRKMSENYFQLKKMFKHHSLILGKIELSEKMFHEAILTIANKQEDLVVKKEFNKIIKQIKKEDK